jgi:ferredoxin--NADP+ reductase/benzoate/toluate 1,2-dioxygenase reductase subunit
MGASSTEVRVLANERLGPGCFLLTFERAGLQFQTGQYLSLGIPGYREQREYSIYSGERDPFLSVLVKEVPTGLVSPRLGTLVSGDRLHVDGPFGYFTLGEAPKTGAPLLLVATGTGISPFHSFVKTHPDLSFRLLHGVRHTEELAIEQEFGPLAVESCVSRGAGGVFQGRVTDRLKAVPPVPGTTAYLCGNCDMIYEVFDLLRGFGIASDRIHTEVYF